MMRVISVIGDGIAKHILPASERMLCHDDHGVVTLMRNNNLPASGISGSEEKG
jgi:hypothetical protein